jgi:hypothetical protein
MIMTNPRNPSTARTRAIALLYAGGIAAQANGERLMAET